jgi:trigger factor
MQVAAEKLSPVLLELAVSVDAERVSSEINKAYVQVSKSARIRGFRPGKAPRSVLVHLYGPRVERDVMQRLVDDTYEKAIAEQKVQAVGQPAIEPDTLKDKEPFRYKARVEIVPEIPNLRYDGFEITKPSLTVSDAVLGGELETLRRANSTLEPVTDGRAAQNGDVVTMDFDVSVDGEVVEGAGGKDVEVELGSQGLIPELEAAILGKRQGDQADAQTSMPENHPDARLRGKATTFKIQVKDIKARILPVLDDEFAKDLGDFATLDDLKKAVTEDLQKRLGEQAENAVAEAIVAELVKANPIDVPRSLVQQQNALTEQELVAQARARGQRGSLNAEIKQRIAAESEVKVRAGLLMAEIAKREGLKIGDKEIEEGLAELAAQSGKNIAKLRVEYRDQKKREMLIGMILENKVLDIIESKSKVTQATE